MKYLLTIFIILALAISAQADTRMLFIADAKVATIEGQQVVYFELTHGAITYRIGRDAVSPEAAAQYNYYQMQGYSLANEGATHLLDVLMPDAYVDAAKLTAQFRGWSFTDLAGRVANGQILPIVIKKFLHVRYTVTDAENPNRVGTIEQYEADLSAGKTWGKAFIPHKWMGIDNEHLE